MQRFFMMLLMLFFIILTFFSPCVLSQEKDTSILLADYYQLIFSAKDYIASGDKKLAQEELDQAFELADKAKDSGALQDIGDLYLKIGISLQTKAENAWHRAGYWRSQGY